MLTFFVREINNLQRSNSEKIAFFHWLGKIRFTFRCHVLVLITFTDLQYLQTLADVLLRTALTDDLTEQRCRVWYFRSTYRAKSMALYDHEQNLVNELIVRW